MKYRIAISVIAGVLSALTTFGQQWTNTTPLPEGFFAHALCYWNGFLYKTGGEGATHGVADGTNVYYASVQSNGTVGPWQSGPPLPIATLYHAGVAANGYLYVIGGDTYSQQSGLVFTNSVYYSTINADGTLGDWDATTPLPTVLDQSAACVWNNSIYVIGGDPDTGHGSSNIYSATIQANGTLSPWSMLTPLPAPLFAEAAAANGFLYVLGGTTGESQNTVYYSRINADGSLGGWSQTSPMPNAVVFMGSVAADGFVFSIGGNNDSTILNFFYMAQVGGNGSLGSWSQGPSLPQALAVFGTAVAGSYIFVAGGDNGLGVQSNVYSIGLPPPPSSPVLTSQGYSTNQAFQLEVSSTTNTGFGFLASEDLRNWTNIGWGFTDTNGLLLFQDTNAVGFPYRFYRAYWPLP